MSVDIETNQGIKINWIQVDEAIGYDIHREYMAQPRNYLESKWEYINKVANICKEKGLDDFMEQNSLKDDEHFRNWLRKELKHGYENRIDPEEKANQILEFVTWTLQTTIVEK